MEELARLENPEDASDGKIRVKMPNKKVNEMFALASQILGGRRVTVLCEDGETRMARIPGKMRRRQWVREGDLIIVWPWDFQHSKADGETPLHQDPSHVPLTKRCSSRRR